MAKFSKWIGGGLGSFLIADGKILRSELDYV